ncbi:MAG: hypothetical protein JSR37_05595 [Verrucomicrobia bacterium]|nr:hypothetical protein [Verrucomicrobiota bacterium]
MNNTLDVRQFSTQKHKSTKTLKRSSIFCAFATLRFCVEFLIFVIICSPLSADRIESLLTIGDHAQAELELRELIQQNPDDKALKRLEVRALAKQKDITKLLRAYNMYEDKNDKELLEEVAWAIIHKAGESSSPIIRQEACIASFMSNDAKGIPNCLEAMRDRSEQLRLVATELAARSRDRLLEEQAHNAIEHDSSRRVRLMSIACVGAMRYQEAKPTLIHILEAQPGDSDEKMAAIGALANISNSIDENQILALVKSDRAFMRILACELVLSRYDTKLAPLLIPLMNDTVYDVRMAAIQCLGTLGTAVHPDVLHALSLHPDIKTKILAHWFSLRAGNAHSFDALQNYLLHSDRSIRLFAASALSHSPKQHLEHYNDPLVTLNLSLGCIWNRQHVQKAVQAVLEALVDKTRLSSQSAGIFSFIGPTTHTHVGGYARLPESEDLRVRLELYSMLACCSTVSLKEPMQRFLQDHTWGITAQSASLMMQENLLYLDELEPLLEDPRHEVALQAAFLLAMYAQDEKALHVLEQSFDTAPRNMKEFILFAISTIGSKSALPFLCRVLSEPSESLRVSAARGILICLYR